MKKTYTIYGSSNHTTDIAFTLGIQFAKEGYKTAIVEIGENNAQLAYQLGIEKQRVKTTENYLHNHKKHNIEDYLINSQDIVEDFLSSEEKSLKTEIAKIPINLSMLLKKAEPQQLNFKEDEWEEIILKIKKEVLLHHDIIIFATTGRTFSFNVFFPTLYSDELLLVIEDKPEDLRLMNQFIIDMEKIKSNLSTKSIFLDYGINIENNDFNKTKINVISTFNLKNIRNLKLTTWEGYNREIEEINNLTNKLLEIKVKKKFKIFKKKKEDKNELS